MRLRGFGDSGSQRLDIVGAETAAGADDLRAHIDPDASFIGKFIHRNLID